MEHFINGLFNLHTYTPLLRQCSALNNSKCGKLTCNCKKTVLFASKGNIHGNGQPHGFLREPYVYLQTPLWEGIPLTITVPPPSGPTRYEGKTRFP